MPKGQSGEKLLKDDLKDLYPLSHAGFGCIQSTVSQPLLNNMAGMEVWRVFVSRWMCFKQGHYTIKYCEQVGGRVTTEVWCNAISVGSSRWAERLCAHLTGTRHSLFGILRSEEHTSELQSR